MKWSKIEFNRPKELCCSNQYVPISVWFQALLWSRGLRSSGLLTQCILEVIYQHTQHNNRSKDLHSLLVMVHQWANQKLCIWRALCTTSPLYYKTEALLALSTTAWCCYSIQKVWYERCKPQTYTMNGSTKVYILHMLISVYLTQQKSAAM